MSTLDARPTTHKVLAIIGDTLEISYTIQDADGNAVDFSGSTSKMLLKSNPDDEDSAAVVEFAISPSAPSNGQFAVSLSADQTKALSPGIYYADHRVYIPSGSDAGNHTVAKFIIFFERPVTRSIT